MFFILFSVCAALGICTVLTACLDIPDAPDGSNKATEIIITVYQDEEDVSTHLKINTGKSATIKGAVKPTVPEEEITFTWYLDKEWLGEGATFLCQYPGIDDIPNRLVVSDREGNSLEKSFSITINASPKIYSNILPADSSEFHINFHQSVTFKWYSNDADDDVLENQLVIDEQIYNVGPLTQVSQSGFSPGRHTFYIIVKDSKGDTDKSQERTFFVYDPVEENP